jgi:hypothetical protein
MARLRWLLAGLVGLVSLGLLPGAALAGECPNEALRTGYSASLPDCRAYEQVSPVDKNGGVVGQPGLPGYIWRSSVDGRRMAFSSGQAFADSQTSGAAANSYVASRSAGGWSTHALLPSQATLTGLSFVPVTAFSPDLSSYVLTIGGLVNGEDEPQLVAGEPRGIRNLFVRSTDSGASRLVDVTPPDVVPPSTGATFFAASPDLTHVFFIEDAKLVPGAPEGETLLYEWSGGAVRVVENSAHEPLFSGNVLEISEDGSRAIVTGTNCGLCLREAGGERTVQIDASQGPGPGGGGELEAASGDESRVFFWAPASSGLTSDTPTGGNPEANTNLYEYDAASGRLTDLTPDSEAEVRGGPGVAGDGSYVYFVAEGALAGAAVVGQPNLYVWHEGTTSFIATLNPEAFETGDTTDWTRVPQNFNNRTARVTPDGTELAFTSFNRLTSYDNRDAFTGQPDREVYLYDAVTRRLVCASCNPSGARPVGSALLDDPSFSEALGRSLSDEPPRLLSSDGARLFFESEDALVPHDTNGEKDVYEYANGGVHLISSGTSGDESRFEEASPSGDDVFFASTQRLVGQDIDSQYDLYDARVGGGFSALAVPVACGGETCRGAPSSAPATQAPGSATFYGAGNLAAPGAVPVTSPPKAKQPKAKGRHRPRKKRRRGRRTPGARHGHSTGKRG